MWLCGLEKNTCVGQWRQSSCLCCPFPPPRLSSATVLSSPLKASHFPPSLFGSSPSPEIEQEDPRTNVTWTEKYFQQDHLIIWSEGTGVTLRERLEASSRSFSSVWMMQSLCAVALRKSCLAWRSLVLRWLCFSSYFLVEGAHYSHSNDRDHVVVSLRWWRNICYFVSVNFLTLSHLTCESSCRRTCCSSPWTLSHSCWVATKSSCSLWLDVWLCISWRTHVLHHV